MAMATMSELAAREFQRVLLVKPSALGDVVHAIPVLVKLRARYPHARIDWLITPENADLVRHHPALSHVIEFPRNEYTRFGRSWSATVGPFRLLADICGARYDLVVDLHGQFRSAIFTLASGAPVRVGFDRPSHRTEAGKTIRAVGAPGEHGWTGAREGSWLAYTHRIPISTLEVHAVDRYLWVAPLLGLDLEPPDLTIHLGPDAATRIESLLRSVGLRANRLAVLVPGTIWETKHWHVEGFAAVGRHLVESGYDVVLAGTKRDRKRSVAIAANCPGAIDLCGRTSVSDLVALIKKAAICVTNDSGSMHIAAAVGIPVVSIFGPTNPVWIGPYGQPQSIVRAGVSCSPCNLRRLCDCPHQHICIRDVTAAMVIDRVDRLLARETIRSPKAIAV
jgi:lipopolysaccharide heptosyltransferase I